jgi:hypothetical protein
VRRTSTFSYDIARSVSRDGFYSASGSGTARARYRLPSGLITMQPTWPGDQRSHRPHRVQIVPGVGEVGTLAAVDPAAVHEQRLVPVVQRGPRERLLREVELGNAIGDPVEELEAVGVALIRRSHRGVDSGGGVGGDLVLAALG